MNRIKTSNRKKRISFGRTWAWIALPVIALTIFALVMITAVLFIGLYMRMNFGHLKLRMKLRCV